MDDDIRKRPTSIMSIKTLYSAENFESSRLSNLETKIMENVVNKNMILKKCENGSKAIMPIKSDSVEPSVINKNTPETIIDNNETWKVKGLVLGNKSKSMITNKDVMITSSGK